MCPDPKCNGLAPDICEKRQSGGYLNRYKFRRRRSNSDIGWLHYEQTIRSPFSPRGVDSCVNAGDCGPGILRNLPPFRITSNVTYVKNGSWEGKLDVYSRINPPGPEPTVFWMHGGSTTVGSKDGALTSFLPYLELGWNVINIEHRQLGVTLAPAALQNSLCAVRWAMHNAGRYNIDVNKLVFSGASSGSWFAVAGGLGVRPDGWSDACPGPEEPKLAAVVNWYGNWDLADILQGPNTKDYAADWVRGIPNPLEVARVLSPLPLRAGVPPVISIHGDADPHSSLHSVRPSS